MKYKIELDGNTLALIGVALRKLPYEDVAGILSNLQAQYQRQEDEAKAAKNAPIPPAKKKA